MEFYSSPSPKVCMLGSEGAGMVTMKSKGQVGTSGHLHSGQGYQCCVYGIERKVP
jgi:hypothetical protein